MNEMIRALLREAEAHDGFPAISDQALREARSGERELVSVGDASPVAVGIVGAGEVDLVVHPDARGEGVGSRLFDDLLRRVEGETVRVWVHGENPAAERLVASRGFTPVRTLLRLELPGSALERLEVPDLPEGVTLQTFDPSNEAAARQLVEVNARAFASHPEQGRLTLDAFRATTREPWFNAADLLLVFDCEAERPSGADASHGTLRAFSWIKTTETSAGETETELYVIAVDPAASGRGLGTVLLAHTLARMAEHSPARVTLYVEGDNDAALALYTRAGFTIAQTSRQWEGRVQA